MVTWSCSAFPTDGVCKFPMAYLQTQRGLCSSRSLPFWEKEKANNLKNEIKEVEDLDNWQAPMPFLQSFFSSGRFKKSQKTPKGTGVQKTSPLGGFTWSSEMAVPLLGWVCLLSPGGPLGRHPHGALRVQCAAWEPLGL